MLTIEFRTLAIINRVWSDRNMTWIMWGSLALFLFVAAFCAFRDASNKFPVPSGKIYNDTFFRDNNN